MTTSVVVTGAARGIGRETARVMVQRGHAVVVTDIAAEAAEATAAEIGAAGWLAQDVRDEASHREALAEAQRHGPLAAWFNNAGILSEGCFVDLEVEMSRRIIEVNVLGVMWGMRTAIAAFGARGGDVVNTCSLSAFGPSPNLSVYAASKAAVWSLTSSVISEVPSGVRLHALCPDGVRTDMVTSLAQDSIGSKLISSGGLLTPQEVGRAAADMVNSRRSKRVVPPWRGPMMRVASVMPEAARIGAKILTR